MISKKTIYINLIALFFHLNSRAIGNFQDCLESAANRQGELYIQIAEILKTVDSKMGEIPCKAKQASIPAQEWEKLKKDIWSNAKFRNSNPNGECNARATALSFYLDKMGYKSEKIFIQGMIDVPLKLSTGYVIYPYRAHTANVVTITNDDGHQSKFILDPMFADNLVPLDEYLENLKCPNRPKLDFVIQPQTSEPAWDNITQVKSSECGYRKAVLQAYKKVLDINEAVESKVGGGLMYSVFGQSKLTNLGPDRATAVQTHCSE
ncbi:protein-glutamine glutaminase family protein [Bdellovibrio sp. HCB337]|uniref:protein-glutamine glutaminase family protein n=1 Tax=Bdellovibrio sp. HCB337 TaxID=3394358 RepID=UPI0039A60107